MGVATLNSMMVDETLSLTMGNEAGKRKLADQRGRKKPGECKIYVVDSADVSIHAINDAVAAM